MKDAARQPTYSEERAIAAARRGDLAAFNTLVLAYQGLAYNVAYRILGNADAAADATQDGFLKAYRNLGQFRGGSFRAWLLRIVTNRCYDVLRSQRRHPAFTLDGDNAGDEHDGRLRAHDESPEDFAIRRELNGSIEAAISRLPADQRWVVVLRDVEGLGYEEIAESAGMPVGTVKSRLSRARARLRDLLKVDGELTGRRKRLPNAGRVPTYDSPPGGRLVAARARVV